MSNNWLLLLGVDYKCIITKSLTHVAFSVIATYVYCVFLHSPSWPITATSLKHFIDCMYITYVSNLSNV